MRSSSIWKKGRLSTIWKTIEVVFHIYSIWFQISLQAKNQLTLLPTTALIVMGPSVVVVCVVFLPIIILPHKTQIILQVDQSVEWFLKKVKVNVRNGKNGTAVTLYFPVCTLCKLCKYMFCSCEETMTNAVT